MIDKKLILFNIAYTLHAQSINSFVLIYFNSNNIRSVSIPVNALERMSKKANNILDSVQKKYKALHFLQ